MTKFYSFMFYYVTNKHTTIESVYIVCGGSSGILTMKGEAHQSQFDVQITYIEEPPAWSTIILK